MAKADWATEPALRTNLYLDEAEIVLMHDGREVSRTKQGGNCKRPTATLICDAEGVTLIRGGTLPKPAVQSLSVAHLPAISAPTAKVTTPITPTPISIPPAVFVPMGYLDAKAQGRTTELPPLVGKGAVPRRGLTHFGGGDKVGKTQRICQLAAEGACGRPVFGTFPVQHEFRTLLLEPELEWPTLGERIERIVEGLKLDPQRVNANFHVIPITQLNVEDAGDQNRIAGWVKGFHLLILDSISSFHHRPNENDNAPMQEVANALRKLARTLDISILTTGHLRKPGPNEKHLDLSNAFDAIRGATSFRAAMDTIIVIQTGNHVAYDFFVMTRRPTDGAESTEEYHLGSLDNYWVLAPGQRLYAQRTSAKARDAKMLGWLKQGHAAGTLPKGKEAVYAKAVEEGAADSRASAQRALNSLEGKGEFAWQNGQPVPGSSWSTTS